jgi:glycosyltransferase involved in cell wall biosynthesis
MGRYTSLRNFKYLIYPFFLQRLVERNMVGNRFDFILSQHAVAAVTAGRLKKKHGIPTVLNFLDYLTGFMETWPVWLAPPPLLALIKKFELSLPVRYGVDGVLTVSDTLADYFAEAGYPRSKILPIYYGFDSRYFPLRDLSQPPNQGKAPVVVMHGSLDHHHLRDIALDAMAHVSQVMPETVFRFVGHQTGALETFLNQAREQAPQAKVECVGFVPYSKVSKHLSSANLGIVPYEESTGTHCAFVAKIVEYLAVGLPIVSTPLNSAMRYFKDEPMIRFSSFNGTQFGEDMVRALNTPFAHWAESAAPASAKVRAGLDWRAISKRAVDFIETIPCRK